MIAGLRTGAEAAASFNVDPPLLLPEPWRQLLHVALLACAAGLVRQNIYNDRDQSIMAASLRLLKAGRNACWAIANLYSETPGTLMCDWQSAAAWHHSAMTAIHAGWQRRLPAGINRAIPLEANTMTLAPLPVRVAENADRWIDRLSRDPLDLSASEARTGLQVIAAGVWITP